MEVIGKLRSPYIGKICSLLWTSSIYVLQDEILAKFGSSSTVFQLAHDDRRVPEQNAVTIYHRTNAVNIYQRLEMKDRARWATIGGYLAQLLI